MKKNEVKVGGVYQAMVSNILCDVRVDRIMDQTTSRGQACTTYAVTNLRTGREIKFHSAMKFRSEVKVKSTMDKLTPQQKAHVSKGPQHVGRPEVKNIKTVLVFKGEQHELKTPEVSKATSPFPSSSDDAATDAPAPTASESGPGTGVGGPSGTPFDDVEACGDCDGTGLVDGNACHDCKGSGEIVFKGSGILVEPPKSVKERLCKELVKDTPHTVAKPLDDTVPYRLPKNDLIVKDSDVPSEAAGESHERFSVQGTETGRYYHDDTYVKEVAKKPVSGLAAKLLKKSSSSLTAPHLIVEARAGVGKTTTIIEGLKVMRGMPTSIVPSEQQQAIWDSMALSKDAKSICLVAFNKAIATELQKRVPPGVNAQTMHSLGFGAVRARFGNMKPESWTTTDIIADILGRDIRELRKDPNMVGVIKSTEELVGKVKMNLSDTDPDSLDQLATYYGIDLETLASKVFELVPKVLEEASNPDKRGKITFDDMIWLCVIHDLPVPKYDLLCVDEAQDLNKCQQQLIRKVGKRIILVGDPKQAVYQFAGSDSKSMSNMREDLAGDSNGCITLPLTVTRRCGKAIVREANKFVSDFSAHESNGEGKVSYDLMSKYQSQVKDGDMVICKNNAPLISQCFRFLKADRRAHIQGRDIGQGLISTIKKLIPGEESRSTRGSVVEFSSKLSDWLFNEMRKENAKRTPSETKISSLQDRAGCLYSFAENSFTVAEIIGRIERIFTDENTTGIRLSSCHRSKGLESDRVFILQPKGAMILQGAKTEWQQEQNKNLLYVSVTRAISELIYVYDEEK